MSVIHMTAMQIKRQLVSTRIVMFALLLIFVKGFVTDPLIKAVEEVAAAGGDYGISFLQPFICLNNSFMLSLLMPLFFLVLVAGLPSAERFDLFVHIRTNRRRFIVSQVLTVASLALCLLMLMLVTSGLMVMGHVDGSMQYCGAVTRYGIFFPDRTGEYVTTLIPPNLYNQESFDMAFVHSAVLLFLEFLLTGMVLLFFSVVNLKFVGIITEVVLTALSAILTNSGMALKWLLPTAHTTIWLHKDAILEKEVFPMYLSYLYFVVLIIIFIVLTFVFAGRYECERRS